MDLSQEQMYHRGLEQLLTNGKNALTVTENYILPLEEQPWLSDLKAPSVIPLIDLSLIEGPSKSSTIEGVAKACEEFGFFQVRELVFRLEDFFGSIWIERKDHKSWGLKRCNEKMYDVGREFFEMGVEDRAPLYSEDHNSMIRVATSFNIHKEKVRSWRDSLRHPCYPLEDLLTQGPKKPPAYRENLVAYAEEIRTLETKLLGILSQALGLDEEHLRNLFGVNHPQMMSLNYYPACPRPDLTIGLQGHSDASGFSILMQDLCGLQILNDGKWFNVDPIPGAFVVNVGDILEVLSNGRFKSVEHRVLTNPTTARLSIVVFSHQHPDAVIAPIKALIDDEHPLLYKEFKFDEYSKLFFGGTLTRKSALDPFRLTQATQ